MLSILLPIYREAGITRNADEKKGGYGPWRRKSTEMTASVSLPRKIDKSFRNLIKSTEVRLNLPFSD